MSIDDLSFPYDLEPWRYDTIGFLSFDDSYMFLKSARAMIDRWQQRNLVSSSPIIIEPFCGSGVVSCALARDLRGSAPRVFAADIHAPSVKICRENFARSGLEPEQYNILPCDLTKEKDLKAFVRSVEESDGARFLIANPPYIPCPDHVTIDGFVNGFKNGTRYFTEVVFPLLDALDYPDATLMLSSICNVDFILRLIQSRGYYIACVRGCIEPLGKFTSQMTRYLVEEVDGNYICQHLPSLRELDCCSYVHMLLGISISRDLGFMMPQSEGGLRGLLCRFVEHGLGGVEKYLSEYTSQIDIQAFKLSSQRLKEFEDLSVPRYSLFESARMELAAFKNKSHPRQMAISGVQQERKLDLSSPERWLELRYKYPEVFLE